MSKYVWYIINLDDGTVQGTNDVEQVEQFVENDSFMCLHQGGSYFLGSREENKVEALPESDEDRDESV